jgi:choline dehydrogenase-like flavoprotein
MRRPIDAREVPNGQIIETDVCIVGGGAAGLTIARELAGCNFRVCLLEAGGAVKHKPTQELCSGTMIGNHRIDLKFSRLRQYGGTANRWLIELGNGELGVRYTPLDEIDFQPRDWMPHSGWPFRKSDLEPFYARAHKICGIGPYDYEPEAWINEQSQRLPLPTDQIVTRVFQFGRKKVFTRDIPDELNHAKNFTAYLYANAIEIETDELGKVATRVKVACLGGNQFYLAAKHFVLAAGGIETARLLLLSDQVRPRGLGNEYDLVGRFFMVHPQFHRDRFTPASPKMFPRAFLYDLREVNQVMIMGRLGLSPAVMAAEQLPNLAVMLLPRETGYWSGQAKAIFGNRDRAKTSRRPLDFVFKAMEGAKDITARAIGMETFNPTLEKGGWSYVPEPEKRYSTFELVSLVEQVPDPGNRVMLGLDRDPLGARRLELHWRWSESDNNASLRARARIGGELAKAGLGTFELRDGAPRPPDSAHHIGTTRMHRDRRQGVVDVNCKVHSVENLFIASSAVFPTGGFANPTLTIVALCVRLADHLKKICLASGCA